MAEWLYEDGIGERRAALVERDRIIAAEVERDGDGAGVGAALSACLIAHDRPRRRARVRAQDGSEFWLANPPATLTEGCNVMIKVTRMALLEQARAKPGNAIVSDASPHAAPAMRDRIAATGHSVRDIRPGATPDALEAAGWSDLLDTARTGDWPFSGGALAIALTPAMTLIDIDGELDPHELAETGAQAALTAIIALGITGSIGIDFPTLTSRAARQRIDTLLGVGLTGTWEKTAMNGFGFVQIVRRRERPSLLERMQWEPALSDALALLRQAERAVGAGALTLSARAAVIERLTARPQWIAQLERRTGRAVTLVADNGLNGCGHAQ
jgi:hypothetical protein